MLISQLRYLTVALTLLVNQTAFAYFEAQFSGHDFKDYRDAFCLSDQELDQLEVRILDLGAGPSPFLGDLRVRGQLHPESRAVDPEYGEYQKLEEKLRPLLTPPTSPRQLETHERFLAYYRKFPEIFIKGEASNLPYLFPGNQKFDLIFSSHFLFWLGGEPSLEEAFHLNSLLKMTELLSENGEIRIFPLHRHDLSRPQYLNQLEKALKAAGFTVETQKSCLGVNTHFWRIKKRR